MKKGKLLLSLAMMCLSIAVLCFGVFSAISVSYTISGTISYTVSDAFVIVNTKVYSGTNQYTTDEELSTLATDLATGTQTLNASGFTQDTSFSIPEYNSTNSESFEKTNVALTLSSTNKSYLVEMTVQNLSPSVNVWAKATWTLGDTANIAQGNNSSQSTIAKDSPKCIYFIVSLKDMTQAVSNISYTMGLNIGIGAMPIEANSDGNTISTTYGTTWAEYVAENSSTYSLDTNDYVLKDGKQLYYWSEKVSSTSTIIERATYSKTQLKTFQVDLQDSGTYWYTELGTGWICTNLSDGTYKFGTGSIRWRLVSLDGETRYNYTKAKPTGHSGAIFVQETVVWEMSSSFNNSGCVEYANSDIRKFVTTSSNFGLTEFPNYIVSYRDSSATNGKVDGDKFWLLSEIQAKTFFKDDSDRMYCVRENVSLQWWLRTPYKFDDDYDSARLVGSDGSIGYAWRTTTLNIRAAFQLA